MAKIIFDNTERTVEANSNGEFNGVIGEGYFEGDLIQLGPNRWHLIQNNRSYRIEVVNFDAVEKEFTLLINGITISGEIADKYDLLLEKMGLSNLMASTVNEVKAPMPGLVLDIHVEAGSQVSKGDSLLVLEAMKMENVLKSPTDGVVKNVSVSSGQAVEKGQVLIEFE